MWRTPNGDRILKGSEAALFKYGLSSLLEWLDECREDGWVTGVQVFDKLSYTEKLAALESAASALFRENIAAPKHTAFGEGAIAAVYAQIMTDVEVEIDDPDGTEEVREAISRVATECDFADFQLPPSATTIDGWRDLVELLLDRILWDRDFEQEHVKPDDLPEVAAKVREFAHIDPDYYSAVPPDPNDNQLMGIRKNLEQLLEKTL